MTKLIDELLLHLNKSTSVTKLIDELRLHLNKSTSETKPSKSEP